MSGSCAKSPWSSNDASLPLTSRASSGPPRSAAAPSQPVNARLRDKAGRQYLLNAATTRIGRLDDNDIVLDDDDVSRYHAMIIDTGTGFVITDLRSTNGVEVRRRPIRGQRNPRRR